MKKLWLLPVALFLWACEIPTNQDAISQQVPVEQVQEVVDHLKKTLEGFNLNELQTRYQELQLEASRLRSDIESKVEAGTAKFEEIKANLEATQAAISETAAAIENLTNQGQALKDSVLPQ